MARREQFTSDAAFDAFLDADERDRQTNGLTFTTDDYDKKFGKPKLPANWPEIQPATRQGPSWPDVWRIVNVPDTKWIEDTTGISCIINWILPADVVRLDVISPDRIPIVTFQGTADNVRKHLMGWFALYVPKLSLDHAAYIGAELERADTERIDYVQDSKAGTKTIYDGPGKCKTVPCKDHSYAWLGTMPCTGTFRCIYCGMPKPDEVTAEDAHHAVTGE